MSGRVRPLLRYQDPSARRKRTGDVETLFFASGRSFPRGERPTPTTVIAGSAAFSASYAAARYGANPAADAFARPANCGRQKAGWFGSLPTTNCFTSGYTEATAATYEPNSDGDPSPASSSLGGYGYTASTTLRPASRAFGMIRSRSALSWMTIGSLGLKRTPITVRRSPSAVISP